MNDFSIKASLIAILLAGAFAAGRYTAQKPTVQQTNTTKTDTQVNTDKNVHTVTKIVYVERKDGTKETDTIITTDSDTKVVKNMDTESKSTVTVTPPKANTLNISILGAVSTQTVKHPITYGLSVQKQIIGPFSAGLFGLNNGTVGLSVGINF